MLDDSLSNDERAARIREVIAAAPMSKTAIADLLGVSLSAKCDRLAEVTNELIQERTSIIIRKLDGGDHF